MLPSAQVGVVSFCSALLSTSKAEQTCSECVTSSEGNVCEASCNTKYNMQLLFLFRTFKVGVDNFSLRALPSGITFAPLSQRHFPFPRSLATTNKTCICLEIKKGAGCVTY